ncbi:PHD finger protein 11C [Apodemus speciosus]|uniref:PHD finger protein 11C n=1 Tax=Apodemus speciosus TaxID=105296 RepID=A0ABQ0FIV6_APOSI
MAFPIGVCHLKEKMERRTCALCPEGHEWSQIYFAPSANIAAHENCLLYSSGLVECEAHDPPNTARNFDVKSVLEKIWRGGMLAVRVVITVSICLGSEGIRGLTRKEGYARFVRTKEPSWGVGKHPVPRITTYSVPRRTMQFYKLE